MDGIFTSSDNPYRIPAWAVESVNTTRGACARYKPTSDDSIKSMNLICIVCKDDPLPLNSDIVVSVEGELCITSTMVSEGRISFNL